MKINGTEKQGYAGLNISQILEKEQYQISRVAVELNGNIVPKASFEQIVLKEDDVLEVVSFVGGG